MSSTFAVGHAKYIANFAYVMHIALLTELSGNYSDLTPNIKMLANEGE